MKPAPATRPGDAFLDALEPGLLGAIGARRVVSPLGELGSRRFLFVTGKGGVGKTTVSAAIAMALAARGQRVLIAMCNTKERLSAILGTPPIGDEVVECLPGVSAVNIEPEKALAEYGAMVLRVKAVSNAIFGSDNFRAFFRAVPGLYEWAMLGKAWFHTTELERGKNRFDVVLFDAPATGHGLDMLRVPRIILDVAPPGVLRRDAERATQLFEDPVRSGVVVVTLPEEMPVTETIELVTALRNELRFPVLQLAVNAVLPPLFTDGERAELVARHELLTSDAPRRARNSGEAAVVAGARRALREQVQRDSLRRLTSAVDAPMFLLPHLFDEASTREGTRLLADVLGGSVIAGR
jgi:anion-transporting  ArsA/GET3 family ATPase